MSAESVRIYISAETMQYTISRVGYRDVTINELIAEFEQRLSAMEHPQPEQREWMPWDGLVWVLWSSGMVTVQRLDRGVYQCFMGIPTHIMPYRPGDPKPEPPVKRGE